MGNLCSRPSADEHFSGLQHCAEQDIKHCIEKVPVHAIVAASGSASSGKAAGQQAAGCELEGKKGAKGTTGGLHEQHEPSGSVIGIGEETELRRQSSGSSPHDSAMSTNAQNFLEWIQITSAASGVSITDFILDSLNMSDSASQGSCCSMSSGLSTSSAVNPIPQLGARLQAVPEANPLSADAVAAAVRVARAASSAGGAVEPYRPHDGFCQGAPRPACWNDRHATAKAINALKELRDGEIESVLRLMCHSFEVDTATVALLTGEAIYLTAACGALPVCVCPDRWGFCGWSFVNPNHELVVVEDMQKDARFAENYFVVSPDYRLVFYCMAPLISSNNHRIGTLCIMGQEPRKFDATRGQLLANMAELLVRQLERNWATRLSAATDTNSLMRSLPCYDAAYLFVEVQGGSWRILHMNPPAIDLLGCEWSASYDELPMPANGRQRQPYKGVDMQELFDTHHGGEEWAPGKWEFTLRSVQRAPGTPGPDTPYDLHFRLATSDGLEDDQAFFVGVPSWLPAAEDGFGTSSFFVRVERSSARLSTDSARSAGSVTSDVSRSRSGRRKSRDGRGSMDSTRSSMDSSRGGGMEGRPSIESRDGSQRGGSEGSTPGDSPRSTLTFPTATAHAKPAPEKAPTAAEPAAAAPAAQPATSDTQWAVSQRAGGLSASLDLPRPNADISATLADSSLTRQLSAPAESEQQAQSPQASPQKGPRPGIPPSTRRAPGSVTFNAAVAAAGGVAGGMAASKSRGTSPAWGAAMQAANAICQAPWAARGVGAVPIEGLVLGPMAGRGSYGRVYRGIYKGVPVAVKIVDNISSVRMNAAGLPLEAELTGGLHHLGIMRVLKYELADAAKDAYSSAAVKTGTTCWMVFEHCNKGCLTDAVVKGWFRTCSQPTQGGTNLRTVVVTAYEIASAMEYLHSKGVVHGDLYGGNIMLCSSSINAHGFTAKVGDFGMAREASVKLLSRPNAYGTMTHMPPETLLDATVSPAMDVYAFGVLLWEMLTGSRAWAGMRHAQIVCQVTVLKRQLEAPPGLPEPLRKLLQSCLAFERADRCAFKEVVRVLGDYLQAHRDVDTAHMELPLRSQA